MKKKGNNSAIQFSNILDSQIRNNDVSKSVISRLNGMARIKTTNKTNKQTNKHTRRSKWCIGNHRHFSILLIGFNILIQKTSTVIISISHITIWLVCCLILMCSHLLGRILYFVIHNLSDCIETGVLWNCEAVFFFFY